MLIATLIVSSVLSVASTINALLTDRQEDGAVYRVIVGELIISILISVVVFYAVYRMIELQNSSTISWAKIAVWLNWAGYAAVSEILFLSVTGQISSNFPGVSAACVLISVTWAAYLKYSKRVRNTYLPT